MKKVSLLIAGAMLSAVAAQEASALPLFARQTGMACSACHFQHFPKLNGFGRSFKASGFTLMGSQGKIEGDNLEIPNVLNIAGFVTAYAQSESMSAGTTGPHFGVPGNGGELSLFVGGRISEFAGFLTELGQGGGAASAASAKLPILFDIGGGARAGIVAYGGDQGAAYSFEYLNTGASDTHKMMGNAGISKQHVQAAYAASYIGMRTAATGVHAVWVNPGVGFVNVGKFVPAGMAAGGSDSLPLTYARAVYNDLEVAGMETAVGVQMITGDTSTVSAFAAGLLGAAQSYKATAVDFQMQGDVAGKELGLYVTYATAPTETGFAGGNAMNVHNAVARNSLNVAGEYEVMAHTTVQLAVRMAKNGATDTGLAGGTALTDNAVMVGATYDLAQNFALGLNYTTQSGTAWDPVNNGGVEAPGKHAYTFLIETAF